MDVLTALLASAPGRLTDLGLIAGDLGTNATQAATMQLLRVVLIISLYHIFVSTVFLT